jgi:anhydro-N-acetylmuramic acid kinase
MNNNWKAFLEILEKEERLIIGLMSGTSLDGLDIALCKVRGHGFNTQLTILNFCTVPYENTFKADIKAIFSKKFVDLQLVALMNEKVGTLHAEMILNSLDQWGMTPSHVDVIASHGQTIFHAPESLHQMEGYPNATMQIGDGDHIAVKTGIVTIADFRQKNIAAGGEGAPLALYGDYLYFSKPGEVRIMLNIGGIANLTYLPGDTNSDQVFSTDVGPGNTMMDQFVQRNFEHMNYDVDGLMASAGRVNDDLLTELLAHEFFKIPFPKTTGPELFNLDFLSSAQLQSGTNNLSPQDVLATLNKMTASTIVEAIRISLGKEQTAEVFFSGGGIHNKLLVEHLKADLPNVKFATTDELGILPDAKEAVLFALLANQTLVGEPINFGNRSGLPTVAMGKICLPF